MDKLLDSWNVWDAARAVKYEVERRSISFVDDLWRQCHDGTDARQTDWRFRNAPVLSIYSIGLFLSATIHVKGDCVGDTGFIGTHNGCRISLTRTTVTAHVELHALGPPIFRRVVTREKYAEVLRLSGFRSPGQ